MKKSWIINMRKLIALNNLIGLIIILVVDILVFYEGWGR
jgi:hypothetical protein